jgi:serine/threonine protein kinase
MTFLQLSSVTHRDLKPGNILFSNLSEVHQEIQYKSLTLIDFGGSKHLLQIAAPMDHTCVLTKRYCSPELMGFSQIQKKDHAQFNPFKSDVFSFGLIILELGTLKLPFSDKESLKPNEYFDELDNENKKLIEFMKAYYGEFAKKSPENAKKLTDIIGMLKKALDVKAEKRPDFVELFCELYKIEGKEARESENILRKMLEIDRKLNMAEVEKEDEGQQICIFFENINMQ